MANEKAHPPTANQKRLVDIAFVIQFYLAALGHLALWCFMYRELLRIPPVPLGEPDEGRFIVEIFVYQGIPISFGVLVAVYIVFRCLLAYAKFTTAMWSMIVWNIFHSVVMCFTYIVPIRLAIPTILYIIALRSYNRDLEADKALPAPESNPLSEPEP